MSPHRLVVERQQFKFSCAHMTVFPDGSKERLHGHNYQVGIALELREVSFATMIPFADLKAELAALCAEWKEYTFLAARNPYFELVRHDDDEVEFRLCGKRYVLPVEDVKILPLDNISVERLAEHVASLLIERTRRVFEREVVLGLEVTVTESPGQGASCYRRLRE